MNKYKDLKTPFEEGALTDWASEYPRPQLRRDSYLSLCGEWELFDAQGDEKFIGNIKVPYPPESRLSGVREYEGDFSHVVYKKKISLPDGFNVGRVLINFGAADQIAKLFVTAHSRVSTQAAICPSPLI